jgi:hypothetical protein
MQKDKKLSYSEFWLAKGEYGKIRVERMLSRKHKRYLKKSFSGNGSCTHGKSEWHSCPYESDMHGNDDSRYCRCCSSCEHDCAQSI